MDATLIITSIITAVLGTGLGFLLQFLLGNRKQNIEEFRLLLEEYKLVKENDRKYIHSLEDRVKRLEDKESIYIKLEIALRNEITQLRQQNKTLKNKV